MKREHSSLSCTRLVLLLVSLVVIGCGDNGGNGPTDGGMDGGPDGGTGGTMDSGVTGGSGGGAPGGSGGGATGGSGGSPDTASIVFVTETLHTAELGGTAGADAICRGQATAAGLEGDFVAWLSTIGSSVADRLVQSSDPYVLVDGTLIAEDWADLVDGSILARINLDASGTPRGGDVWTGTLATGGSFTDNDCAGFTSASAGFGLCGSTATAASQWTENITPACGTSLRLYCFEQP